MYTAALTSAAATSRCAAHGGSDEPAQVLTQTGLPKNGPSPCLDQESDPWSPLSLDRQRSGLKRPMNSAPVVNTYDNDLQSSVLAWKASV